MSDDKTEEPTDHKLREARKEGQFARSQDITTAVSMVVAVGTLLGMAHGMGNRMRSMVELALAPGNDGEPDVLYKRMAAMGLQACILIAPVAIAAAVGAAIGAVAQAGFELTPNAVGLKLENVSPAQGIKKVFSLKSVMSFLQLLLKATALSAVLWVACMQLIPLASGAVFQTPDTLAELSWSAISKLSLFALGVFVVFAPLDYALQRHQFMKGQRMSPDEIKREHKGQEGDPEVKGKRKQLAHELANEAPAKQAVRSANAVIVNPTHYAVAIRYRANEYGVPIVVAKGIDDAALEIRRYAQEEGVPVFTQPPLARALHQTPVMHQVPEEYFEPVAVILRWVDDLAAKRPAS